MILSVIERGEGLAEGQIADDVKGSEVVPFYHVDLGATFSDVCQLIHEHVDIAGDQIFLLSQRFFRKGMREVAADASVIGMRGVDNVGGRVMFIIYKGKSRPLGKIIGMGVDILPSPLIHEGQLVWRYANNGAIGSMQLTQFVVNIALSAGQILKYMERCPKLRPWEFAGWMDVDIVEAGSQRQGDQLWRNGQ